MKLLNIFRPGSRAEKPQGKAVDAGVDSLYPETYFTEARLADTRATLTRLGVGEITNITNID